MGKEGVHTRYSELHQRPVTEEVMGNKAEPNTLVFAEWDTLSDFLLNTYIHLGRLILSSVLVKANSG